MWLGRQGMYWEPFRVSRELPGRDERTDDVVVLRGQVASMSSTALVLSFTNITQFFVPEGKGNPPEPPDVTLVVRGDGTARVAGLEIDGESWP